MNPMSIALVVFILVLVMVVTSVLVMVKQILKLFRGVI